MDELHERVARVGLSALAPYGFALAGGYAVQAYGILSRMSEDVDLFTNRGEPHFFAEAVDTAEAAWAVDGLKVGRQLVHETFARFGVTDEAGRNTKVELGYDWRALPPTVMDIGPVLHLDDAVANKLSALFGRGAPRDYIDVHAARMSGAYSSERLIEMASERDTGFNTPMLADALTASRRFDDDEYVLYGLTTEQVAAMRADLLGWAAELRAPNPREAAE